MDNFLIGHFLTDIPSRFFNNTWTNWCDFVRGGCPEGKDESNLGKIRWDSQVQNMITLKLMKWKRQIRSRRYQSQRKRTNYKLQRYE